MNQPLFTDYDFWEQLESDSLKVCKLALENLSLLTELPQGENEINRKLDRLLIIAYMELNSSGYEILGCPVYQANNQPNHNYDEIQGVEHKIPDFQFFAIDTTEQNPILARKCFVVECKRIGEPSGTWIFNQNYVNEGIQRFANSTHKYGEGFESGAMIGYIQNMDADEILNQVNQNAAIKSIVEITLSQSGWKEGGVSELQHDIIRTDFGPSPFKLFHLWVDLRRPSTSES